VAAGLANAASAEAGNLNNGFNRSAYPAESESRGWLKKRRPCNRNLAGGHLL